MTPIEIFALIVLVAAAIKIIVILLKPGVWIRVIKKVYASPVLTTIISLILAVVVLYYLLDELTIIQIFAAMLFICLLVAIGISAYSKEMFGLAEKISKDRAILKKAWLPILVWIILIIWALVKLFV